MPEHPPTAGDALLELAVAEHPSMRLAAFVTRFPAPLGDFEDAGRLAPALRLDSPAPLSPEESLRVAVRDMLRHGGYKPTGRGKPASEYLVRAAAAGTLASINPAVDACNAVSLHSGFPISVVDLDRACAPFHIAIAPPGARYTFNAAGQEIDLEGLLCLFDANGACGNAVKDAQRTKTGPSTTRTFSVLWGCSGFEDRLAVAVDWYRELLRGFSAATQPVILRATVM
jgi:DNA/RNA-binding domain of Phe-tRNA-synthetase-like protein